MKSLASIAAAAAMTGLIGGAAATLVGCQPASTPTTSTAGVSADKAPAASCKGLNACKGKGGCSTGDQGCKGKNSCQGKGGCKST